MRRRSLLRSFVLVLQTKEAERTVFTDPIWHPIGMNIGYLGMIFVGQRWMKSREAVKDVKVPMLIYNLYQVCVCDVTTVHAYVRYAHTRRPS